MRGFSSKRILAVLVAAVAISLLAHTGVTLAQAAKPEKAVKQKAAPVKVGKGAVQEAKSAAAPPKPAISPTTEVELQRRFNALRSELLDDRAGTIEWWLAVVAIVLTFFGIVVAILGLIGFRRFQSIEKEARESVEATNQHLEEAERNNEEAKGLVEEIKGYRDETKAIRDETAESAADEPERVKQIAEDVRENPESPLIEKAIADAISLQQEQKLEEAIEKWQAIAKISEGNDIALAARAWFSMGFLFGEQGEWKEAIVAFDKALQLNPSLAIAFYNRGVAKGSLGQHEAAILDYNEAICLDPDYAPAYNNRGIAKNKMGQHEAAIADFEKALRLRSDDAATYYNRGLPHLKLGNKEDARRDFEKARALAFEGGNDALLSTVKQKLQELDEE